MAHSGIHSKLDSINAIKPAPELGIRFRHWSVAGPGRNEISQKFTGRIFARSGAKGAYTPGAETPDQPDEVDVLDAGDVVEGLGVNGLASTASSGTGK